MQELITRDVSTLSEESNAIVAQSGNIKKIESDAMNEIALALYRTSRDILKAIDEFCEPAIKAANDAHKAALDQRRKLKGTLESESVRLKRLVDSWATRKMIEEKAALAEQHSAIREAAEAAALERAQALEEAAGRVQSENTPAAQALANRMREGAISQLDNVLPPKLVGMNYNAMQSTARVTGTQQRSVWKWRTVDKTKIPDQYWVLNEGAINVQVRTLKGACQIPGIEVYEEISTGVRG